jgi:hypothetical protein
MLSLVNRRIMNSEEDFHYEKGGCFLRAPLFIQKMGIKHKNNR